MIEEIDIVGISHYFENSQEFIKGLPKGAVVTLRKQPENIFDKDPAIAAFCQYQHIGYIDREQKYEIYPLFMDSKEIKIRYEGKYVEDSITLSTNALVNLTPYRIPQEQRTNGRAGQHDALTPALQKSVIGFDLSPYIPNDEYALGTLIEDIVLCLDYLSTLDCNDATFKGVSERLNSLLIEYIPLSMSSLSRECIYSYQYIFHKTQSISAMSEDLRTLLAPRIEEFKSINREMKHGDKQHETFLAQMKKVNDFFESHDIYRKYRNKVFSNQAYPPKAEMEDQITEINIWLGKNVDGIYDSYFSTDEKRFARELANYQLSREELYLYYSHIAILGYNKMLWRDWPDKGPFIKNIDEYTVNIKNNLANYLREIK